jgi:hypothetical protein
MEDFAVVCACHLNKFRFLNNQVISVLPFFRFLLSCPNSVDHPALDNADMMGCVAVIFQSGHASGDRRGICLHGLSWFSHLASVFPAAESNAEQPATPAALQRCLPNSTAGTALLA